jgi:uncharacterized membrane protein affecting hemolysin expression
MTEKQVPKAYKVSVVDRDTGSTRPSRRTSGAAAPSGSSEADKADDADAKDAGNGNADAADAGTPGAVEKRVGPGDSGTPATGGRRWPPRTLGRKGRVVLWCIAILGVIGTAVFGHEWASLNGQLGRQAQVRAVTSNFLTALTNFDSKNVDADFNRIQSYATGDFAKQSNQFFGSTIRSQLEAALASSRGQIRSQYVQSINGTNATVYSVVDQTYINDKMKSPSADELRIVTDLTLQGSTWKVSNVTVLNNSGTGSSSSTGSTPSTSTSTPTSTPTSTSTP